MAALWVVSTFMATLLAPASLFSLSASIPARIPVGAHAGEAMRLWDPAPLRQRDLMLAAILIFDGAYRDALLQKEWTHLPPEVQASIAGTLAEIRTEGEMYIGYIE